MEKGERKMAKGDLFSTVLRGFHKEQVSQYLNDLIRKYEQEKDRTANFNGRACPFYGKGFGNL